MVLNKSCLTNTNCHKSGLNRSFIKIADIAIKGPWTGYPVTRVEIPGLIHPIRLPAHVKLVCKKKRMARFLLDNVFKSMSSLKDGNEVFARDEKGFYYKKLLKEILGSEGLFYEVIYLYRNHGYLTWVLICGGIINNLEKEMPGKIL